MHACRLSQGLEAALAPLGSCEQFRDELAHRMSIIQASACEAARCKRRLAGEVVTAAADNARTQAVHARAPSN